MKLITLLFVAILGSFQLFAFENKTYKLVGKCPPPATDSVIIDLANATFATSADSNFIDIPVYVKTNTPQISAIDLNLSINESKIKFIKTFILDSNIDGSSNFNLVDHKLAVTFSGPNTFYSLPTNTVLFKLRFKLDSPTTVIYTNTLKINFTRLNGDLCLNRITGVTNLGLNSISNSSNFTLSPNPTSGILKINSLEESMIEISNENGQIVVTDNVVENSSKDLNLGHLKDGIYFVKVFNKNAIKIDKIVLKK